MNMNEVLKLALEALETVAADVKTTPTAYEAQRQAITALRQALANEALDKKAENARELGLDYEPAQQEPVFAIRLLTNQCFALAQERDELQKQVWRYENNGVTCQTYRHKVDASCAECNVHEVYTFPPAQRTWVGLTDEEIVRIASTPCAVVGSYVHTFARAIEAKLQEKNT